jgi:uncharacterized protein YjbI with pentapeptide repeats
VQQEEDTQQRKKKTRRGRVWDWTGFGDKTAWDWMQLLIVPVVLAVGALLFNLSLNARQLETEERRAAAQIEAEDQRAQEERLQTYLEQMGTLLIDEGLLDSEEDDEARYLARARTLAVFRRADDSQKRRVVEFLAESGLAGIGPPRNGDEPVVSLADANLAGADLALLDYLWGADLTEADLSDAFMMRIDLDSASLARAQLDRADLTDAHLPRADLTDADLPNANLQLADLRGAHLEDTKLEGANLSEANLEGATGVSVEELEEQAASLEAATMPDGTEHD